MICGIPHLHVTHRYPIPKDPGSMNDAGIMTGMIHHVSVWRREAEASFVHHHRVSGSLSLSVMASAVYQEQALILHQS